jgi:hypothetical protein
MTLSKIAVKRRTGAKSIRFIQTFWRISTTGWWLFFWNYLDSSLFIVTLTTCWVFLEMLMTGNCFSVSWTVCRVDVVKRSMTWMLGVHLVFPFVKPVWFQCVIGDNDLQWVLQVTSELCKQGYRWIHHFKNIRNFLFFCFETNRTLLKDSKNSFGN